MQATARFGFMFTITVTAMLSALLFLFGFTTMAYADVDVKTQAKGSIAAGQAMALQTQATTVGNLKYGIIKMPTNGVGTVKVIGVANKKSTKLIVPSQVTINGARYQVVEIGKGAFMSCKKLKTVEVANTVKTVRADAFRKTGSLTKLVFRRAPTSIRFDKNALRGVGKGGGKDLGIRIPTANSKQTNALLKAGLNAKGKVNGYPLSGITIKLNANKGKVSKKTKTVTNFKKYGKLPTPKRNRYVFEGWYTEKNGGVEVTKNTLVQLKKGMTLYAHWYGPRGVGKTITRAEYNRIKVGMSYSEVKFFIGGKGTSSYSYTREEWIEDSHEEWVDTSYEEWVDDSYYDEYGNYIDGGHYETIEDGYWQTIDDSYSIDIECEGYYWKSGNGGIAYFDFEDGELVEKSRYGL